MTVEIADVVSSVVVATIGNGLLSAYLLQRLRGQQEDRLERTRSALERDIRTLQTSLDRTVFVHRAHFEVELAAIRDIWARVAAVRNTMGLVRPVGRIVPRDEQPEEREAREREDFTAFNRDFNALLHAVDTQSPFVPHDIYERLDALIQIARAEVNGVALHRHNRPIDWEEIGEANYRRFCDGATVVSDAIRTRLEMLTLLPGDRG